MLRSWCAYSVAHHSAHIVSTCKSRRDSPPSCTALHFSRCKTRKGQANSHRKAEKSTDALSVNNPAEEFDSQQERESDSAAMLMGLQQANAKAATACNIRINTALDNACALE